MAAIHMVDKIDNLRKLKDSNIAHEWESGGCMVDADVAEKLIGADLYVHEGPSKSSRFGGRITGFRIRNADGEDASVVFRFQATHDHRDIKTSRGGWTNDRKIVW